MAERTRRGTPTVYRGVRMRSRLEAMVASWFDNRRLQWEYEPVCFGDEEGQYYPDFLVKPIRVMGRNDQALYVEVKPADLAGQALGSLLTRMESIWSSEPDAYLAVCAPNDATFHQFPVHWFRNSEKWTAPDGVWVRCRRCSLTGLDSRSRLQQPFEVDGIPTVEPWICPSCERNCGFEIDVPWHSAEYYAMTAGGRVATYRPTTLGEARRAPSVRASAVPDVRRILKGTGVPLSYHGIQEKLRGEGRGWRTATLVEACETLVRMGHVRTVAGPRNKTLYLYDDPPPA